MRLEQRWIFILYVPLSFCRDKQVALYFMYDLEQDMKVAALELVFCLASLPFSFSERTTTL
jgi:hypothetical protein